MVNPVAFVNNLPRSLLPLAGFILPRYTIGPHAVATSGLGGSGFPAGEQGWPDHPLPRSAKAKRTKALRDRNCREALARWHGAASLMEPDFDHCCISDLTDDELNGVQMTEGPGAPS